MEDCYRNGLQFLPSCLFPCSWLCLSTSILCSVMCLALTSGTIADVTQTNLNAAFTFGIIPVCHSSNPDMWASPNQPAREWETPGCHSDTEGFSQQPTHRQVIWLWSDHTGPTRCLSNLLTVSTCVIPNENSQFQLRLVKLPIRFLSQTSECCEVTVASGL